MPLSQDMQDSIKYVLSDMRVPAKTLPLGRRAALFVKEIKRLRSKAVKMGFLLAPLPSKETLVRVFLRGHKAEQKRSTGFQGIGGGEAEGAASGAIAGATAGSVVPGIGTAIGAVVGGALGAFAGHSQSAAATKQAKNAIKTAELQKQAAQTAAKAQVTTAKLGLQTEQVKSEAARKIPAWMWVALAAGGVAAIGGSFYLARKKA